MKIKTTTSIASLLLWGIILISAYHFSLSRELVIDKLNEIPVYQIWLKNLIVLSIFLSGVITYGFTTLILTITNAFYIGYVIIPYVRLYYEIYPRVLVFVLIELGVYIIASSIGFSGFILLFRPNQQLYTKKKNLISIVCCFLLLIAAFLEKQDINNINFLLGF